MVTRKILTLVFMLYLSISAMAQQTPTGYNPFVPANLDDPAKLPVTPVVESSYHRYWVTGDVNYTDPSTFAWYVENGTMGTYDSITDSWTPLPHTLVVGAGTGAFLQGITIDGIHNSSEVWVRWNDGSGGSIGYIAAYERSSDSCIVDNQLTGFKHNIIAPPEIWFIVGDREECADQGYSVTVQFNNVNPYSFPYTFSYSYPGNNGTSQQGELQVGVGDLDATLMYTFDLLAVQDLDVTRDETYPITLLELRDKFGSSGKLAPLGTPQGQFKEVILKIFHLPQTGDMSMD
jgi:hypothetical protein